VSQNPSSPSAVIPGTEDTSITPQQWKWSILAGMASYLDAGSIVALGAGLTLFKDYLKLGDGALGFLVAIGPNAIGCALGAIVGGWLGDKLGRKFIYQYVLLVYAAGILLMALAVNREMLFLGTFIVGVAVGADLPASLALVGELAPAKARGKLLGFTQVAWALGPVVVLLLAFFLAPLGLLGIRIVFLHLFLVAVVTWMLRRGLTESVRWKKSSSQPSPVAGHRWQVLFSGSNLRALLWTSAIYIFWGIAAGTAGIFTPYMIQTFGAGGQATSVGLACASFFVSILVTVAVFMPYSDRNYRTRKLMWGVGSVMQVAAYGLLLIAPFTIPVVLANIILFAGGAALAGEAFYKVFSQELFPTLLRSTAQGITFGVARIVLGIWSFFVPTLARTGIGEIAGLLLLFLLISGGIGFFFMPDTSGKSLEQIERERA